MIMKYYKLVNKDGQVYGSGVTDGDLPEGAVECSPNEAQRPLGWVEHVHQDMIIIVTGGAESEDTPEYCLNGTYELTHLRLAEWALYTSYPTYQYTHGYWPVVDKSGDLHLWPATEFGVFVGFAIKYIQAMIMHRAKKADAQPSNVLDLGEVTTGKTATETAIHPNYHAGGRH